MTAITENIRSLSHLIKEEIGKKVLIKWDCNLLDKISNECVWQHKCGLIIGISNAETRAN